MRSKLSFLGKRGNIGFALTFSLLLVFVLVATQCVVPTAPGSTGTGKQTVKISFIGPLTGGNAGPGLGGRNSAMLAVKERNEDPNAKYHYELVVIDDECKPDVGVQAALKAASDPVVVASISHYCSVVAISTTDTFHNAGLPSMVWGAVLPDITYGNEYPEVFRVNGTMIQQNQVHAQMMWDDWGYRQVSIIHDTSDYGRGHLQYFSEAFEALGGKILSAQGVTTDQQDFTAELTKVKAEDPDVVYFGGLTPVGIPLYNQMVKLGIPAQFDGTSGIKNESFNEAVGAEAGGVISFLEGAPLEDLPGGMQFKTNYEAAGYEEPPEAYGPFAYTAAVLVLDAIEKVGPDRTKVMEELATIKDKDTIIGKVTFDEYGQNIVPLVTAYVSQDGQWVPWGQSEYASGARTLPGMKFMKQKGR
jgi:branched-chain amino acid transport system substrate-binding protein